MTRPSEPLLRWLRQQIDARGHTVASLAEKLGRPRAELRKVLTGASPMTVDDLVALTEALELTVPTPQSGGQVPVDDPVALGMQGIDAAVLDEDRPEPAQFGNTTEAVFRQGFELGLDMLFLVDPKRLDGWGGPDDVREDYASKGRDLPIKLDAAYHRYHQPAYDEHGVSLTLSFDRLYRCTFPWPAIEQVVFKLVPPEPVAPPGPKKRPGLRLVK